MTTTHEGVEHEADIYETDDEGANAFLNQWTDAGLLSEDGEGAKPNTKGVVTTPGVGEDESTGQDDDDDILLDDDDNDGDADEAQDPAPVEATDDAVVKVTVDGVEQTVAVKDLKRLFGQEASLTRKSQEVADARRTAEENSIRYIRAHQNMLGRAEARFAPYADLDWMVAQKTLNVEEFAALRKEALSAYEDVQFLNEEATGVVGEITRAREMEIAAAAQESLTVLQEKVPNWTREHYDEIRQYAVSAGLPIEAVNQIVDPHAILLMRDAMLYRRAKDRTEAKRKAAASPTRPLQSTKGSGSAAVSQKRTADSAMKRLRSTGSDEDAAAAFLSGWSTND